MIELLIAAVRAIEAAARNAPPRLGVVLAKEECPMADDEVRKANPIEVRKLSPVATVARRPAFVQRAAR
jgi:hypothetical protein